MAHSARRTRPRKRYSTKGSISKTADAIILIEAAESLQLHSSVKRRGTNVFETACTARVALAAAITVFEACANSDVIV